MQKLQMKRVLYVVVAWTLLGSFLTLYDHLLLQSHISSGYSSQYLLSQALFFNMFSGSIGGLLGGIVLVSINQRFRTRPYIHSVLWVVVFFVLIVSFITLLTAAVSTAISFENPFTNPEAKAWFLDQVLTTLHLKNIVFWGSVVALTVFAIQISDKFGPGNLWRIIVGKYHLPREERRVVMFLDLKSSTTIAEKLGDQKYHEFLHDVFADITRPIINSKAEIYQYVGDEVVILWKAETEHGEDNCLRCFFEIRKELERNNKRYLSKYSVVPQFKAGAHYGNAVAGEIGIIKRDITYSGDMLNTAARIQAQCSSLDSSFLVSNHLYRFLSPDPAKWIAKSKGAIPLKGKTASMELLSIDVT